ncbi:RDD family protein [Nocardioides zeae]|uniref:RDD family membrane protein YckC n=2 Tax=Nocardioides zeae TaxID=1457234 RepID=A0AAJ1WZN3_9ACTN|nr:RDD family protein [Nocardioides zeae]MDQ1103808.1 putative RDD family membrane protein YckC [Nocardioides zeae]
MASTDRQTASWARRMGALLVDWFACMLVVIAFVGPARYFPATAEDAAGVNPSLLTLGLLVLESTVLTCLAGGSFGKLVTRLRVVRYDGHPGPIDPIRAFGRSFLVALVIPPLVFRPDGRGLHDIVAGTMTVPLAPRRGGGAPQPRG